MFFKLLIILRELEKIMEQAYLILEDVCEYTSVHQIWFFYFIFYHKPYNAT